MKELEVGERVTLEVTETDKESCKGCFFDSNKFVEVCQLYPCSIKERLDHKFFFSSRRRHTRCGRDWSSDVCSSDLTNRWL